MSYPVYSTQRAELYSLITCPASSITYDYIQLHKITHACLADIHLYYDGVAFLYL